MDEQERERMNRAFGSDPTPFIVRAIGEIVAERDEQKLIVAEQEQIIADLNSEYAEMRDTVLTLLHERDELQKRIDKGIDMLEAMRPLDPGSWNQITVAEAILILEGKDEPNTR